MAEGREETERGKRASRKRGTYNGKQRNLACSGSDSLELTVEGRGLAEVEEGSGGLCNTREKEEGWRMEGRCC